MAVPKLRFPEFTDDWEQRKFGDVFEEYSEKNHEDLPPLTIVQGSGTIPREESGRDIKYDKSSLNNYKLVNPGDFILHLRSFEGGLEVANSQGIVSPAYHIFRGIRTDSRFYYPFFRSHDFINILLKPHVYGIRDGKSIDVEGMKSIKIPYPDFDEQKRIGDFFDHLDNAITLHQRKLEDLRILKKSMLQKMFPSEGNSVPEVRFPEFTAAWEQRKLGSISEIKTGPFGSTLHADDYVTDGIPIITTEHFKNGDLPTSKNGLPQVSDEDYKRLSSYVLNEGDIVFSRVGSVDINALVMPSQRHWLFSGRVLRVRPDMVNDPQFLHTVLETETIKADIRSRAVGQTMPSINTEILNETLVMMPQFRAEQEQIGQFFYSLNKTITLHQSKLERIQMCNYRGILYGSF